MRSYGKNFTYKKTVSYKQRQSRCVTEWDIRLDITSELTPQILVENLKSCNGEWSYALISGVELPDKLDNPEASYGSKGEHVHMCLVLHVPKNRSDVLRMVRGPRKLGDEYAAPRNSKFTYAGWVIHHSKPGYKREGECDIIWESGDLPMDPYTTDNALKIQSMLKKFGSPTTAARFKGYTDLLAKHKIKEKIEELQMQLEDEDVE
jgi:hypothetical protein